MTRVLYVARHGETDWNALGRLQGHTDVPLNERGRAQAQTLAERLRDFGIVEIVSSDLMRARQTAEIVATGLSARLAYVDVDLRERGFGIFEGLTQSECAARYPEEWAAYAANPRHVPPGAEAYETLSSRVATALARAAERTHQGGPALVVAHGGVLRAFVAAVTGVPVPPVPNAAVYRVVFAGARVVEATLEGT